MHRLPTVPALDGVRALAVAFVVADHLSPDIFSGGFIGVVPFFVLSGFLITVVLLNSVRQTANCLIAPSTFDGLAACCRQ